MFRYILVLATFVLFSSAVSAQVGEARERAGDVETEALDPDCEDGKICEKNLSGNRLTLPIDPSVVVNEVLGTGPNGLRPIDGTK